MKKAKNRCVHRLLDWGGNIVCHWFGGFKR